jgi:hypothetical protein
MSTIHPRPALVYMRDDGFGGLDLVVKTSTGGLEVQSLSSSLAATWLTQISEYMGRWMRDPGRRSLQEALVPLPFLEAHIAILEAQIASRTLELEELKELRGRLEVAA